MGAEPPPPTDGGSLPPPARGGYRACPRLEGASPKRGCGSAGQRRSPRGNGRASRGCRRDGAAPDAGGAWRGRGCARSPGAPRGPPHPPGTSSAGPPAAGARKSHPSCVAPRSQFPRAASLLAPDPEAPPCGGSAASHGALPPSAVGATGARRCRSHSRRARQPRGSAGLRARPAGARRGAPGRGWGGGGGRLAAVPAPRAKGGRGGGGGPVPLVRARLLRYGRTNERSPAQPGLGHRFLIWCAPSAGRRAHRHIRART